MQMHHFPSPSHHDLRSVYIRHTYNSNNPQKQFIVEFLYYTRCVCIEDSGAAMWGVSGVRIPSSNHIYGNVYIVLRLLYTKIIKFLVIWQLQKLYEICTFGRGKGIFRLVFLVPTYLKINVHVWLMFKQRFEIAEKKSAWEEPSRPPRKYATECISHAGPAGILRLFLAGHRVSRGPYDYVVSYAGTQ